MCVHNQPPAFEHYIIVQQHLIETSYHPSKDISSTPRPQVSQLLDEALESRHFPYECLTFPTQSIAPFSKLVHDPSNSSKSTHAPKSRNPKSLLTAAEAELVPILSSQIVLSPFPQQHSENNIEYVPYQSLRL